MTNYIHQFPKKLLCLAFLTMASFLMLSSCKNAKTNKNPTCVQLTKAQIEKWIKKGYTTPGSGYSLRFTTAYAGPGAIFSVYAIIQKKDGSVIDESLAELDPIKNDTTDNCGNIKLDNFIFSGTIPASFSDMDILKSDGSLKDSIEYVKFIPYSYIDTTSKFTLLAYHVFNVKTGGIRTQPMTTMGNIAKVGLPCPPCPNCTTYCPQICNGQCTTSEVK